MTVDSVGLESIKRSEGIRLEAYRDSAGYWTIGVGHLLTTSERSSGKILIAGQGVHWSDGLTTMQAEQLLSQDLDTAEAQVTESVTVALTQNQFNALVSFVFNIGGGAFAKSRLLRLLNAGAYADVPDQMRRWVFAGGEPQKGLVKRRAEEIRVWNLL